MKESFIPERGWVPQDQLIEELEQKAASGKLSGKDEARLRELKKRREFPVLDEDKKPAERPPLPEDWRPGNYL